MSETKRPSHIYRRSQAIGRKPEGLPGGPRLKKILDCDMYRECGACSFINRPYMDGLRTKHDSGMEVLRKAAVLGKAIVVPPMEAAGELGNRAFVKLAVRACHQDPRRPRRTVIQRPVSAPQEGAATSESLSVDRRFAIGIFKPRTHDLVSMINCPLHSHQIKRLLPDLRRELDASPLTPYNERSCTGDVRYVAVRSAHLTDEIMVTFVVTQARKADLRKIVSTLRTFGHNITSAHMNIHPGSSNAIFGPTTEHVAGTERMREKVCDIELEISPTAFFQVNPWQADNLYRRIEMLAGPTTDLTPAWDLYCGAGMIGLVLARSGYRVFGLEENPSAIEDAKRNAALNHLEARTVFASGLVENMMGDPPAWARQPKLVVVNPSRRGMADSVRLRLAGQMAQNPDMRLIYVSCEVETLARDLKDFCNAGFRLRQIEAFDMFPQTDNIEWLAVVTK